jgi:hypothetical protein
MGNATTPWNGVISKSQVPNPNLLLIISIIFVKCIIMDSNYNTLYDLDKRTFNFAQSVREYVEKSPKRFTYVEIGRQLIRSAGSVGANYIEADEALSRKDFVMRIKICKKEAKESRYWL